MSVSGDTVEAFISPAGCFYLIKTSLIQNRTDIQDGIIRKDCLLLVNGWFHSNFHSLFPRQKLSLTTDSTQGTDRGVSLMIHCLWGISPRPCLWQWALFFLEEIHMKTMAHRGEVSWWGGWISIRPAALRYQLDLTGCLQDCCSLPGEFRWVTKAEDD